MVGTDCIVLYYMIRKIFNMCVMSVWQIVGIFILYSSAFSVNIPSSVVEIMSLKDVREMILSF